MEIIKNVRSWGNSAGVLLPKEWAGNQVKVTLIDRSLEIKKEVFNILSNYLEDILGIYMTGSYARNEATKESDIDIIAISNKTKKEIISGRYHISIATLEGIKNTMKAYPELIMPRLKEARVILNSSLLEALEREKIKKISFKNFVEESKRVIKINQQFLELDKEKSEYVKSKRVIYSLILRLRGILLIKCFLKKKRYSNVLLKKWLLNALNEEEFEKFYNIYRSVRDDKKIEEEAKIETAEKLLKFLKKQLKYIEK